MIKLENGKLTKSSAVTVTERASHKILAQLQKRGAGIGIRIGVKTTGCSGLAYILEYVDQLNEGEISTGPDEIFFNGYCLVIAKKDIPYLQGMEIDYVREGLNEGFQFNNPNEKDRCGCGESFRI